MKMRNKGKVHPSPNSSSPSSDSLSVLKLLPAAILALLSVLSPEDREVLAYLITRSLKSTHPPSFLQPEKTPSKKISNAHLKKSSISTVNIAAGGRANNDHSSNGGSKTPLFDCECFECYTSFWFRWDSSPNRELISQAIEAFEENLNLGEQSKKGGKNRKKDKTGRRGLEKKPEFSNPNVFGYGSIGSSPVEVAPEVKKISSFDGEKGIALPPLSPEKEAGFGHGDGNASVVVDIVVASAELEVVQGGGEAAVTATTAADNHKGLARKVLPDVLGLMNSRLWNLWSPNV